MEGSEPKHEIQVAKSDLRKICDALLAAHRHHKARDESNAALHLASTTRYSELTSKLEAEGQRIERILNPSQTVTAFETEEVQFPRG